MGAFGGLILTNRGRNLQVKAQTGVTLNFTRMAIGDGTLGTTSILELNALKSEKKSLLLTKLKAVSGEQATLGSVLSNQDISSGFYFREIGIFATDPDIGEILYCYGNAGNTADYIPAGSEGGTDLIEKTIDVGVLVGNATNVTATINQSLVYETPEGSQEKANQAKTDANAYTDTKFSQVSYPVTSVNSKTGAVTLTAEDVGADTPSGVQVKINTAITNLINSSPTALDTLKELADALGNDPNFATTILNRITTIEEDDAAHQAKIMQFQTNQFYKNIMGVTY